MHDGKATPSPAKGSGKVPDELRWQSSWWQFYPLIEQAQRPVAWSRSSTIFTAHPTQPLITARMFSSSKQFIIPSPSPVIASPSSYDSPTVISVSPSDDWLFAYFPGRDCDGTGCLWKRGFQIDNWIIKEWWSFIRGGGVVAATWAGPDREWVASDAKPYTRLPPRGPSTPVSSPTLLLVTQNLHLNVCYYRSFITSLKIMSCSLTYPEVTPELRPQSRHNVLGHGGLRLCVNAAIGLGYNESAILVAMRSHLLPSPSVKPPSFNPMDLSLPLDISQQFSSSSDSTMSVDWESWGEESTIELCEVKINFDGVSMTLASHPLPPLHKAQRGLTQLTFVCTPPSASDPSPKKKDRQQNGAHATDFCETPRIYLAASFLDFGDYNSAPRSEVVLHSLSRNAGPPSLNKPNWLAHQESARVFSSGVVTFVSPHLTFSSHHEVVLFAGMVETSGALTGRRKKEVVIGHIEVLRLPDLNNHDGWEPSPIISRKDSLGDDLVMSAVVSPNKTLLCIVSSSLSSTRLSVHPLPQRRADDTTTEMSRALPFLAALLCKNSTADVTHGLSLPSVHVNEVSDTIYKVLDCFDDECSTSRILSVLGVATEVYRAKAAHADNDVDNESFTSRSQFAHDICSLATYTLAFEDCKEGDTYDLDAVWQLVALCGWVIDFVERLVKECVLSSTTSRSQDEDGDDLFGSAASSPQLASHIEPSLSSPILLTLVHPFALTSLHDALSHLIRFRGRLELLTASEVNAQTAKDVLIDLVDHSGIDLNALQELISKLLADSKSIGGHDSRKCLAMCQPTPAVEHRVQMAIRGLMGCSINKARLFLRPLDLVDEISQLSVSSGQNIDLFRDVVSKADLVRRKPADRVCMRCGGRSEVGTETAVGGHISLRWHAWEKLWTVHCICGGYWATSSYSKDSVPR